MGGERNTSLTCRYLYHYSRQEKQQSALTLVMEAERIVGTSDSTPTTDVFRTVVSTFKSDMDNFMLRAEQRYKDLETLVNVHRFCEQVCV